MSFHVLNVLSTPHHGKPSVNSVEEQAVEYSMSLRSSRGGRRTFCSYGDSGKVRDHNFHWNYATKSAKFFF